MFNRNSIFIYIIHLLISLSAAVSEARPINGVLFYTKDSFYGQVGGSYFFELFMHREDSQGVSEFIIEKSIETDEAYEKCGGRYSLVDIIETTKTTRSQFFPYYYKILSIKCD